MQTLVSRNNRLALMATLLVSLPTSACTVNVPTLAEMGVNPEAVNTLLSQSTTTKTSPTTSAQSSTPSESAHSLDSSASSMLPTTTMTSDSSEQLVPNNGEGISNTPVPGRVSTAKSIPTPGPSPSATPRGVKPDSEDELVSAPGDS